MKRIVVFVVVMILVFSAVSCSCGRKAQEKKAEALAEEMLESQIGEEVEVDIDGDDSVTIKTDDGDMVIESNSTKKWPEEMPSDVPEIKGVNIEQYVNMNGAQSVVFTDCKEKTAMDYKSLIEKAEYKIEMEMNSDGAYIIMAVKDGAALTFTWADDTGEGSITYIAEQ